MRRPFRTAPAPYSDPRNLPQEMRTMPFEALRSTSWPQFPDVMQYALLSPQARVNPATVWLPIAALNHPYTGAMGAAASLYAARAQLASLQAYALNQSVNGAGLTPVEAAAVLSLHIPTKQDAISWAAYARRQCPDMPAMRQVPFIPRFAPPPRVARILDAVANGRFFNPGRVAGNSTTDAINKVNSMRRQALSLPGPLMRQAMPGPIDFATQVSLVRMMAPQGHPVAAATSKMAAMQPPPHQAQAAHTRQASMPSYSHPQARAARTRAASMPAFPTKATAVTTKAASAPPMPSTAQRKLALRIQTAQYYTRGPGGR